MNKSDKWLDKIAKKVDSYEEDAPLFLWDEIEESMNDQAVLTKENSRKTPVIPMHKSWWAIAAALFIGILSYSIYQLTDNYAIDGITKIYVAQDGNDIELPTSEQIKEIEKSTFLSTNADQPEASISKNGSNNVVVKSSKLLAAASDYGKTVATTQLSESQESNEVDNNESVFSKPLEVQTEEEEESKSINNKGQQKYDDLYANVDYSSFIKTKENSSKGGVGAHMGSGGAFNPSGVTADGNSVFYEEVNITNFASPASLQRESPGKYLVRDGMILEKKERKTKEFKHNQPISFGLSFRKPFSNNLSLESGLMYTYLSSTVTDLVESNSYKQKLHYLGIPLKVNWDFWEYNRFSLYASGGGAIEICVAGKVNEQNSRPTRPQFSLIGGVGAQVAIHKNIGFYIEPGVSYYFKDGSGFETIRTEKPFNFNLNMGLRLTF